MISNSFPRFKVFHHPTVSQPFDNLWMFRVPFRRAYSKGSFTATQKVVDWIYSISSDVDFFHKDMCVMNYLKFEI